MVFVVVEQDVNNLINQLDFELNKCWVCDYLTPASITSAYEGYILDYMADNEDQRIIHNDMLRGYNVISIDINVIVQTRTLIYIIEFREEDLAKRFLYDHNLKGVMKEKPISVFESTRRIYE